VEKLAQHKKVLVMVAGRICSQVLTDGAGVHFLIIDEVQDLMVKPKAFMTKLIAGTCQSRCEIELFFLSQFLSSSSGFLMRTRDDEW
jgi:hypothetical protein